MKALIPGLLLVAGVVLYEVLHWLDERRYRQAAQRLEDLGRKRVGL